MAYRRAGAASEARSRQRVTSLTESESPAAPGGHGHGPLAPGRVAWRPPQSAPPAARGPAVTSVTRRRAAAECHEIIIMVESAALCQCQCGGQPESL